MDSVAEPVVASPPPRSTRGRRVSIPVVAEAAPGEALYAAAAKLYPRAVEGRHARQRWSMVALTQLIFYGLPWLSHGGRQAVLFDIEARRFHLFGLVLWPQDFILLVGLLVFCAIALFLFTALAGRLWCGYACPQTVYSALFQWIETRVEGDWLARRKRDTASWTVATWGRKVGKHGLWLLLAGWTGITFVGYFIPIRSVVPSILAGTLGTWAAFWVLFYTAATYANAGWMREQLCKYLCPYARFQGVMMDQRTLTVTYDAGRGEPRGTRGAGSGACIDCHICVQVCPTGIDIRRGLQIECLNCGLCADACDGVMQRTGAAPGLIRYCSSESLQLAAAATIPGGQAAPPQPWLSRRILAYVILLCLIGGAIAGNVALRVPVRLDVMRDRNILSRQTSDGQVENVYRLQLLNMSDRPRTFEVVAQGPAGFHLGNAAPHSVTVAGLGTAQLAVDVDADPALLTARHTPILIEVHASDDASVRASSRNQFLSP